MEDKPNVVSVGQKGLTLVEVLTAIVLFAMITTILYSFLFMGISMYKRVAAEAQLRSQVNVFYSKLLEYIDQSVYVYASEQKNEIIVIKKPQLQLNQIEDQKYIEYYSITLDTENDQIRIAPVTGNTITDRDTSKQRVYTIDSEQFDLDQSSVLQVERQNDQQLIQINLKFFAASQANREQNSPSIQLKSEIPIYVQ